jgi:hypothetical protein
MKGGQSSNVREDIYLKMLETLEYFDNPKGLLNEYQKKFIELKEKQKELEEMDSKKKKKGK